MKLSPSYTLSFFLLLLCSLPLCAAPAAAPEVLEFQGGMDSVGVQILLADTVTICRGDTLILTQENNVGDAGLVWRPGEGFISGINDPAPSVTPIVSRFYVVTVSNAMGTASDSIYVNVNQLIVPQLVNDTTICQNEALSLVQNPVLNSRGTTYDFSPGTFLDDSTDVNSIYISRSGADTVFTLITTSADSVCADTQMVRVDVINSNLQILREDTIISCNTDDNEFLTATVSGALTSPITWSPTTGIVGPTTGATISVDLIGDITYFVTAEVNGCTQTDSVAVRVDSLPPDFTLTAEPVKDPYCIGDTFYLVGAIFDVEDYPLITHEWLVSPGIESPDNLLSGVFTAVDSMLYMRETTNGACIDTAEIQINVIQPPLLTFEPEEVCAGIPTQVQITFDRFLPSGTVEWMDPMGLLSCTDCLDPIITTNAPAEFELEVIADGSDCPSPAMYSVGLVPEPLPILTSQLIACSGAERRLIVGGVQADGFSYRITGGGINTTNTNVVVSPTESTTYTIETTTPCRVETQTITLDVLPEYVLSVDAPSTVCPGENFTVTASVNPDVEGGFQFRIGGEPIGSIDGSIDLSIEGPVTIDVSFADASGCSTQQTSVTVDTDGSSFVPEISVARPDGTPIPVDSNGMAVAVEGSTIVLTAVNAPANFDGTITWEGNGDPRSATGPSITFTVPVGGTDLISYRATVTSSNDCEAAASVDITILEQPFSIPEIISANSDGTNDNFKIFFDASAAVDNFTLLVFNRWGQKVFESGDPDEGWDGNKNGKPQNLGTYLFLTKFEINGVMTEREGQFSLVR